MAVIPGGIQSSTPSEVDVEQTQFVGPEVLIANADGKVGFFDTAPIVEQTIAAAGTDAATTQALANSIRTILLAYGLVKA
jgi:hypothetical protein